MHPPLELAICGTDRRYRLTNGTRLTVGRLPECDIHVSDQAVSRRHCTFEARDGEVIVTDLDSVNGTFVNDRSIRSVRVAVGDRIRAGSCEMEIGGAAAAGHGLDSMLARDPTIESVIRKRFEPTHFDWLATAAAPGAAGGGQAELLQRAQRHLSLLHRSAQVLASARDMNGVAEATLGAILEVTGGDRAAIVLRRRSPQTGEIEVAAAQSRLPDPGRFVVSSTLVADVIEKGVSTFAYDAVNDERFSAGASVLGQQVRAVMCVPLRTSEAVLGALYVDSVSAAGRFAEADLELLSALGNQAGVALHRVRLMGEVERLLIEAIRAIVATIDARDGYTHRHSERVAALAGRMAAVMGLGRDEQKTVELSALLHDVGKIGVPDSILNKPGLLTPEEFAAMKEHPVHGARILSNIQSPSIAAVLPGVLYHHERWDGSGYPEGLRGEQIPFLGRLLGVADFCDALTSERPYRVALSVQEAVVLVENGRGTHFDPAVVEAALALHRRNELVSALSLVPSPLSLS